MLAFYKKKKQYLTFNEKLASYNLCENVTYRAVSLVGHAPPTLSYCFSTKVQLHLILFLNIGKKFGRIFK